MCVYDICFIMVMMLLKVIDGSFGYVGIGWYL